MKQVLIRHGGVSVEEVPDPQVAPGQLLVRNVRSCISVGTEMSGVKTSNMPLWKRALKQPENVKKVYERVKTHGLKDTRRLVQQKLDTSFPIGYSTAGVVVALGAGVEGYEIGDRVTCAGSQAAFHAEMVSVPKNLVCPVPDELDMAEASTVTLGAIALQGVRRATPTLGETFVVIGLGILGQITHQLLKANGVRTIGTDLDQTRIDTGLGLGMDAGVDSATNLEKQVARLTNGNGADGVIITAATASDEVISTAFKCCRRKGRVVLVGAVGLDINREDIYAKELDFFISTSYGPGRYDNTYEEKGLDYPLAYVRWTENRNMLAYLDLLAQKRVDVASLLNDCYPIDQAKAAYDALQSGDHKPLSVILEYAGDATACVSKKNERYNSAQEAAVSLSVIGAGGFAQGTLLPIVAKHPDLYGLDKVVTQRGHNAVNIARQFNAKEATTDADGVCRDKTSQAIMVATRHNHHGPYVLKGLKAGKHVFVEKPTCLTREELDDIQTEIDKRGDDSPIVLTGFNRRFSKYAVAVVQATKTRAAPMIINCRINGGHIPLDHWVHREEGGGRNLGEACHFYDLFNFITGSKVKSVVATSIDASNGHFAKNDNFVATISYEDGSVATLTYTALGDSAFPKESVDVFCDGAVYTIDDYKAFRSTNPAIKGFETKTAEKGHEEELLAFAHAIKAGGAWPIPFWQQRQAMEIAFAVEEQIMAGQA